jgi:[ribosomal protein S18]-alanine N-acetyltransferase
VHIRPAIAADIPSILDLERQSATAGHWTEEQYRQAFHEGTGRVVLVAEDFPASAQETRNPGDTSILGFLVARHLAPEWELENIVVAPTARRKGLGKRLLGVLLDAARKTNSNSMFLEVRESNAAARTLYEKAGFKQTGRRESYYTNPPEDAVLYRLTLP